jgi:uncharacterized membrane protein
MINNPTILNSYDAWGILARFAVDIVFLIILIGFVYFRYSKKEKFFFTFFLIGIVVFFICSIMKGGDMGVALAIGLFAVFGILRLRTRNFGVKDMSYLFATIGMSVINSLGLLFLDMVGVILINLVIIVAAYILEKVLQRNLFKKHSIRYNNIELLRPENRTALLKDISTLTGRNILKIKILKIDYKKKSAQLDIFFKE